MIPCDPLKKKKGTVLISYGLYLCVLSLFKSNILDGRIPNVMMRSPIYMLYLKTKKSTVLLQYFPVFCIIHCSFYFNKIPADEKAWWFRSVLNSSSGVVWSVVSLEFDYKMFSHSIPFSYCHYIRHCTCMSFFICAMLIIQIRNSIYAILVSTKSLLLIRVSQTDVNEGTAGSSWVDEMDKMLNVKLKYRNVTHKYRCI